MLAVALMQPAPPALMLSISGFSLPENTSKPSLAKASIMLLVCAQSSALSFMPAICLGYAFIRRSTSLWVIGTAETGGI